MRPKFPRIWNVGDTTIRLLTAIPARDFRDRGDDWWSRKKFPAVSLRPWDFRDGDSEAISADFRGRRCTLAAALPRTKEVGWKANLFLLRIPSCGEGRRGRQDRGWVGWPLWCNRTEIVWRCTKRDRAIMRRGLDRTCTSDGRRSRWNPCYI